MADAHEKMLQQIVSNFPSGILLAFAYGSGIVSQKDNVSSKNMIDFVFVIENSRQWHEENLRRHRNHYSFVGSMGGNAVALLQDKFGAGVYYNTLVPMEGRIIKYGTVSPENFLLDLNEWKWLYLSGRLHKPIKILRQKPAPDIAAAMEGNLLSAANAALLCLPESFTEEELYLNIAGLSYAGDFRMVVGENKSKVANIVAPNIASFRELYHPVLSKFSEVHFNSLSQKYHQSKDSGMLHSQMFTLPRNLRQSIVHGIAGKGRTSEVALCDASKDAVRCSEFVRKGVASIVRSSSITQSLKGVLSAGGQKTFVYSAQKLTKMLKGMIPK